MLDRLQKFVLRHCGESTLVDSAIRYPSQAFPLLLPYLVLRGAGLRTNECERALDIALRRGALSTIELVPFRLLVNYFLWKSGLLTTEAPWRQMYMATTLGQAANTIVIDNKCAAYSITHTIFYMTDFGRRGDLLTAADLDRATSILESLLVHYWRLGHYDLLGELLVSCDCLRARRVGIYADAAAAFRRANRQDGSVPAERRPEQAAPDSDDRSNATSMSFDFCYHTTLIAALHLGLSGALAPR
jgi:hypothetical protein